MANAASPPDRMETADGLKLHTATSSETEVFSRFFAGYDKTFVLPNEKEDEAGLARCFALNAGEDYQRLSALYGAYSEVCFVADAGGCEVGGANFIAMPIDESTVTANLNYIFVHAEARGEGHLSRLLSGVREAIAAIYPGHAQTLIFIEQNDPFRMSAADYERDTTFTGLDQFDRLRIWARRGARVVDFPYAQPPLSPGQAADDTLVYSVLGPEGPALDACVLEAHLRRFFGVSVLKGADLEENQAARAQLAGLGASCAQGGRVPLLDPSRMLDALRRREDIAALWPSERPATFRDALRAYARP
jgi:GNAT superfamily N-acetyltransferase